MCFYFRSLNSAYVCDPFLTRFSDEVLDQVVGREAYSFTNGFSGYHQVRIVEEEKNKNTFAIECGSFAYNVMAFGLKNAPMVFLCSTHPLVPCWDILYGEVYWWTQLRL